jgi:hypothetical protein
MQQITYCTQKLIIRKGQSLIGHGYFHFGQVVVDKKTDLNWELRSKVSISAGLQLI